MLWRIWPKCCMQWHMLKIFDIDATFIRVAECFKYTYRSWVVLMKLCQYLNTPKCLNLGGHVLTNLEDSLQAAEVQEGDHLTAAAQQVNISASTQAFALWAVEEARYLPGEIQSMVLTAPWFKISSKMFCKFRPQVAHLQRSWQMDQPLPRAIQTIQTGTSRVTALQFRMSSDMWPKFRPPWAQLLKLADGSVVAWVIQSMVATARQSKISWGMSSKFRPHFWQLPRSWPMDPLLPGAMQTRWWLLLGSRSAQECAPHSGHRWRIRCNLGRWIRCYLGPFTPEKKQFASHFPNAS